MDKQMNKRDVLIAIGKIKQKHWSEEREEPSFDFDDEDEDDAEDRFEDFLENL